MKKSVLKVVFVFLMLFAVVSFSVDSFALPGIYSVRNERELKGAIKKIFSYDYVRLENDIEIKGNLCIDKSMTLDLGGHTLYLADSNASIKIGKKEFSHMEPHEVVIPGYYRTYDDGDITYRVWHPDTVKVEYRDVYKYCDGIEVSITNGNIRHIDASDGADGVNDTWSDYNGKDGKTPKEVIKVISGTLRLYDVSGYGGYGGKGGNGKTRILLHVPFGGGNGGNGGKGGNGGDVINLTRDECNVFLYGQTLLIPGKGGKGGERGCKNENYWLYSGFEGSNGKDGKDGVRIRKVGKVDLP